jgi:hypothetical protein
MEASMKKLLGGLAATAALALFVSSAQADCSFHNKQVMASTASEEAVAVGTHDGPAPIAAEETTVTAAQECAADQKDCVPSNK